MTTLTITPNWKNKSARFNGTIAAGEHVAVYVNNGDGVIADTTNLRLRVVNPANGRTLAQFPMPVEEGETPDEWNSDLTTLSCELDLNTVQMLMAVPPAANVPLLFVLDDYEGKTLFFKDFCEVTHWPRRVGEEEPVNLDDYKDIIAEFREDIYGEGGFKDRVESAEESAAASASAANAAAESASGSQTSAANSASAAQSAAQSAAASATAASHVLDDVSTYISTGDSLFELEEAGYLQPDGTVKAPAGTERGVTDYIELTGRKLTVKSGVVAVNDGLTYACFYDAGKSFLSALTKETLGLFTGDIAVPSGAKYIRFTLADATAPAKVTTYRLELDIVRKSTFAREKYDEDSAVPSKEAGYLQPDGTVKAPAGTERGVTDYIELTGRKLTVKSGVVAVNDGLTYACFYDAGKSFLSALTKETLGLFTGDIAVPSGAKYIRLTLEDATIPAKVDMFVQVQDMAFSAGDAMDMVDRLGAQLGARADVSFTVDAIFKGVYVKATDGTEGVSDTRACTDYLIVNNDRRIAFTGATGSIADSGYCFGCVYDAEKKFIMPILAADYEQGEPLVLPPSARYIRLNVATTIATVTIMQKGFIAQEDKEFNFLLIGSSYGLCSVLQFPFLVADAGIKICCGNLYKSGVGLPTIAEQIENETENGWDKGMIYTNEAGEWVSATTDLDTMLRAKKWDCISIQRSAADKKTWNAAQEAALETVIGHIRDVCGEEGARPQIVLNTIFAAEEFSTDKQSQCNETMEIVNTALAIKKRFGIDITNVAMTVQNVRLTACATYGSAPDTTFHDLACDTNGHLDYGVGSYVAGLALFEQLILPRFGKSVLCVEKVASLSDLSSTGVVPANKYTAPDSTFKSIAKTCALVTWANPYEISTGLAHAYPTTPETVVQPGRNAMLGYVGAQPTLSPAQLANIAAVSDALAFDATHSYAAGDPVVYNGTLYTFTAAHTGAWTGSDVSAVDIIAILAALRTAVAGKQDALSAAQIANIAAVPNKADAAALRYDLPTNATAIDTASQETVEGETVNYGAATLADRTGNRVSVTAALDELRVTFPPAVSGKLRDFGLRVEVGTGSAALTAPALVPVAPTGETLKLENNAKQIPALADGAASAKGVTLLYFSESAPGVFFAKGEQVEEVA